VKDLDHCRSWQDSAPESRYLELLFTIYSLFLFFSSRERPFFDIFAVRGSDQEVKSGIRE
jgi:hypothetical protein